MTGSNLVKEVAMSRCHVVPIIVRTRKQWPSSIRRTAQLCSRSSSQTITTHSPSKSSLKIFHSYHPPRLYDKVAIITGASSGLGRAIALQVASHSTKLVVCADLQAGPRKHGDEATSQYTDDIINSTYGRDKAIFVKTDVSNTDDVASLVNAAVRLGGRIDVLVNCAGLGNVSGSPLLHELEEDQWDQVLNVNLRGTFLTNKYVLRQMMIQSPRSLSIAPTTTRPPGCASQETSKHDIGLKRRGTIINVSSMLGSIALPDGTAAYCASKGGVLNLTRQLALDYAPYLINVNALCPGFLETAMTAGNRKTIKSGADPDAAKDEIRKESLGLKGSSGAATPEQTGERMRCATPFGEWGKVEDVARMVVSLASEDGAWVTGAELVVDGGYSAGGFGGVAAVTDPRNLRHAYGAENIRKQTALL